MRVEAGNVGRFAASAAALVVLAVAVPIGLARMSAARFGSANPLAGVDAPWDWRGSSVVDSVTNPVNDGTVVDLILRLSLCAIWFAVVMILVSSVVELVHMARHGGMAMPSIRGLGWSQGIARYIAVGLLVLMPVITPKPTLAASRSSFALNAPVVAELSIDQRVPAPAALAPVTPDSGMVYVVQPGDSVMSIAANLAQHDQQRAMVIANEIIDANLHTVMPGGGRFTSPAYIEAGWQLIVPGGATPPTPVAVSTPTPGAAATHSVEPGDTLWDIAATELGDPTAWPEIWDVNSGDDMGGGRTFDDPNLILPGWKLDLPVDASSSLDPPIVVDSAEVLAAPRSPEPTTPPPSTPSSIAPLPRAAEPTMVVALVPAPTPSSTTDSATTTTVAPTEPAKLPAAPARSVAPDAPSPIRMEHAAMLAAGILALVGVRRRQRLRSAMPRSRVPEPRPETVETERLLRTIDSGERAARVDVACRAAAFSLIGSGAQIVAVQVSTDGDVALTLSSPAPAPTPWTTERDGAIWRLSASVPIELMTEAARQVGMPCVALVQLGIDADGDDVLVDLEACGTLAIDAHPAQADAVVRAMAAGLSTSLYAEVAHLITVSMPADVLFGHRNAHQADSIDAAFDLAASLVGSTSTNVRSSFELRSLRTGGEMWEPAVILLRDADHRRQTPDELQFPLPGHGVALVTVVEPSGAPDAPARLVGEPDNWRFTFAGHSIALTPVGLDRADVDAVIDVLHDAERPLVWMDETTPDVLGVFEPTKHAVIVKLLGGVEVTDRDGRPGQFERSKTVELIAWLATHRTHSTRSAARTALWELDVRDATFANVVSEARRALGRLVEPPPGEEWVARTLTEQLPLHPEVVTDAQLIEERLDAARVQPPTQAIETLRPAVATVTGMPFAGTSYLWPDAEGITSNLVLLAITAASELAAHALSIGDIDLVFWATGHGLAVLPGHEELIALRMRAHARSGDLAGVRQEWESYERVIIVDAWSDGEPAPKLLALRRELLTSVNDEHASR